MHSNYNNRERYKRTSEEVISSQREISVFCFCCSVVWARVGCGHVLSLTPH